MNQIHFFYEALDSREQQVARIWDRRSWPLHGGQPYRPSGFGASDLYVRFAFFHLETDLFSGNYTAVLDPYCVEPINAAAAPTPASVSEQIYAASHQGDPATFLLWHVTPGLTVDRDPGRVSLLHSVSYYASRMGRPPCCWDDENFANRGNEAYGTAP